MGMEYRLPRPNDSPFVLMRRAETIVGDRKLVASGETRPAFQQAWPIPMGDERMISSDGRDDKIPKIGDER